MTYLKKITIILLILISGSFVWAQEKLDVPTYNEVYLSTGGIGFVGPSIISSDLRLLAPNSTILNRDLSVFNRQFGYGPSSLPSSISGQSYVPISSSFAGGILYEAGVGTYALNKTNSNRNIQLRVGIGYGSTQNLGTFLSREVVTPFDTFTSSAGNQIFSDSIFYETISATYSSNQMRVHADLLYHTNPDRRFSLFFGAGLVAGATFNNQTEIFYTQQSFITTDGSYSNTIYSSNTQKSQTELYNNRGGWLVGGYVPVGVSYRLGKTTPLLNQTSLYIELRPGLTAVAIPELATYLMPTLQSNFGLRVRF